MCWFGYSSKVGTVSAKTVHSTLRAPRSEILPLLLAAVSKTWQRNDHRTICSRPGNSTSIVSPVSHSIVSRTSFAAESIFIPQSIAAFA